MEMMMGKGFGSPGVFRKVLGIALFLLVGLQSKSQDDTKEYEAELSDGSTMKVTVTGNDAYNLPRWQLMPGVTFFLQNDEISVDLSLSGIYRVSPKLWADFEVLSPVFGFMDAPTTNADNPGVEPLIDATAQWHYSLFDKKKMIKRRLNFSTFQLDHIDARGRSHYVGVMGELPVEISRGIELDAGVVYTRRYLGYNMATNGELPEAPEIWIPMGQTTSFLGGLSYKSASSLQYTTKYGDFYLWTFARFYANVLLATHAGYTSYLGEVQSTEMQQAEDRPGYVEPVFNRFGYRFGFEGGGSRKNNGFARLFGIEIGAFPNLSAEEVTEESEVRKYAPYLIWSYKFSFGPAPKGFKKKRKE